jgi:NifU-like protein involved in Fe-S cluster formation
MNDPDVNHSPGYSALVAEHFEHPRNVGMLTGHYEIMLCGAAGQREHGTEVIFHVGIDNARIVAMTFQVFGCPHTIAASSILAERLTGRPVESLNEVRFNELAASLDLPVEKMGRLLIIEDALRKCRVAWDNRRLG